jgi:hypothetical protein
LTILERPFVARSSAIARNAHLADLLAGLRPEDSAAQLRSRSSGMAVLLTKIVNDRAVVMDTLLNQQTVECPRCEQTFRFGYSDDEWHKLSAWLGKATRAIRESHKKRHEAAKLELRW